MWGLPGYILLVSCISVTAKKVGAKLVDSRKRYTQKKCYTRLLISFASYHMIHDYTSTKVLDSDSEFPFTSLFIY